MGLVFHGVTISSCSVGGGLAASGAGKFTCTLAGTSGTSGTSVSATKVGGPQAPATFKVT